ncbi:protein adenylyltransferase Fic [Polaribacter gangjinensis]|uniref:protein adenylyltransferase n=1 Tax=Polaribacter gangjinensis TaxID=574710 RepID=A0A2S7WBI9_9FLAO|nr:cell filamentation protein Fic [Polaribacter gangjinensis]
MSKVSIRFFDDREVRAVWDDENSKWRFSVLDIVAVLRNQDDYTKNRNYWKYLKAKLKKENSELVSSTTQLKLVANDGKCYLTDMLDYEGIITLGKEFPSKTANRFIEWFTYSPESIDGKSKTKAYALFETSFADSIEVGTAKGLQQIHAYIFGGLYDFAGQIRTKNIAKGGYRFEYANYLNSTLLQIDSMPQTNFDEIVEKYVSMNKAHPFMEGNGRSTRIWLDLILKKQLKKCVDWSKISKTNYMNAMIISSVDSSILNSLLKTALTTNINSREMYMKGIDYSYYYEENE